MLRPMRETIATRSMRLSVALTLLVTGCEFIPTTSRPIYPADWPAIVRADEGAEPPDFSGTYCVLSEPASQLVYPAGGEARSTILAIPIEGPKAPPQLGRRALPWYFLRLEGTAPTGERGRVHFFLTKLRLDALHPDGHDGVGWVRLTHQSKEKGYLVEVGVGDTVEVAYQFSPTPEEQLLETHRGMRLGYFPFDGGVRWIASARFNAGELHGNARVHRSNSDDVSRGRWIAHRS